jgi:hypothetical protein
MKSVQDTKTEDKHEGKEDVPIPQGHKVSYGIRVVLIYKFVRDNFQENLRKKKYT